MIQYIIFSATILCDAQLRDESIRDCLVADLGCGTGRLGIGCLLMECGLCVGFDVDRAALDRFALNCEVSGAHRASK